MSNGTNSSASNAAPLAFLSHASRDNERFVLALDVALRARGIRVWFDRREIRLGDNLVDRIFDQGLASADYVILILSRHTEQSEFVHKELTTAVISRITNQIKAVIPILLDGVEPPVALRDTAHLRADTDSVEATADQIRDAIFGLAPAPVAPQPAYAGIPVHRLRGLGPDDERVLEVASDLHLDVPRWHPAVGTDDIIGRTRVLDMSDDVVLDSLEVLEHGGYLERKWELGNPNPYAIELSPFALTTFLRAYRPREYRRARYSIVVDVVNGELDFNTLIDARGIGEPLGIAVLNELRAAGMLQFEMYSEGTFVTSTAMLKRFLQQIEREDGITG